ncbi:MAG: tRNA (N(6)-L-threonylcarbamoyladenosine(37)-C(2))-methylthiotransferase MtaB [Hyphomicrobiales bacterium]|nr:tRNA (N(6)-L-threonylcarbamoyladenosine(37)-C(2))-methylthiotransferase MtaB [Hyphomicrobiales bacterium]
MTVDVVTFGCRLNIVESESMRLQALEAGHDNLVIFNTCAVTAEATRQARQAIRRLKRERPDATIVVTGCAAQIEPAMFAGMDEVDRVIGNSEKSQSRTWAQLADPAGGQERVQVADIMAVRETASHLIDGFEGRTRAFVQVQNGCDHRCTFCIIPYGRGPSRSVAMGAAVDQIKRLVDRGYKEVVLTGVDMTSWGADLPGTPRLGQLMQSILTHVPDLPRLRLSSIDSIEADEALIDALASEKRLMPHLHLSLQAGDDMILKRMKRRHLRDDAIAFSQKIKSLRPDIVFGADIIAGFPTETEEMFANSLALVRDCGLTYLHVFPFSPREGTPAAKMPQLPKQVVKERAKRLREAGDLALDAYLNSQLGTVQTVLVEQEHLGRGEGFATVRFRSSVEAGQIVQAPIIGIEGHDLIAA